MLSPADMLVVGVAALLFFGPDQLPKVARRAGQVVRDVQATSASFIHEMERAADEPDHHHTPYVPPEPYAADPSTVKIDPSPNATIDHEPATSDHAWQVTADLNPRPPVDGPLTTNGNPHPRSSSDPATSNGEFHARPDSADPRSSQKSGPTEVNPPQSNPN